MKKGKFFKVLGWGVLGIGLLLVVFYVSTMLKEVSFFKMPWGQKVAVFMQFASTYMPWFFTPGIICIASGYAIEHLYDLKNIGQADTNETDEETSEIA